MFLLGGRCCCDMWPCVSLLLGGGRPVLRPSLLLCLRLSLLLCIHFFSFLKNLPISSLIYTIQFCSVCFWCVKPYLNLVCSCNWSHRDTSSRGPEHKPMLVLTSDLIWPQTVFFFPPTERTRVFEINISDICASLSNLHIGISFFIVGKKKELFVIWDIYQSDNCWW